MTFKSNEIEPTLSPNPNEIEPTLAGDLAGAGDVVTHLAILITHGWTEKQIIQLARMKGNYKYNYRNPAGATSPNPLLLEQMKRWLFARWLYRSGRIVG